MAIDKDIIDSILNEITFELKNSLKEIIVKSNQLSTVFAFGKLGKLDLVKKFLQGNLDERIVYRNNHSVKGVVIQGTIINGMVRDLLILDAFINPISIVSGNEVIRIIEKDTYIPTKKSFVSTTAKDNQTSIMADIVEEYEFEQLLIGSISLVGISLAPKGIPQIKISIDIDANTIISVEMKELGTEKSKSIRFS